VNDDRSKLVPFERPMRKIDPNLAAQFAETARKLRYERETAAELVTRLLRDTPRGQWLSLAKRAELQNAGALEHLSKEVDRRLDRDPQEALTIAQLATKLVETLPRGAYPGVTLAQLRCHAWKDLGQALSFLGRYDEALAALEKAEAELAAYGALAHDQAIVWFVRAIVLQHLRRFDEAESLLAESDAVFSAHRDDALHAKCALAKGNLLVRRGDHRAARAVLMPLLEAASPFVPIAHMALGWCSIEVGDAEEAVTHFMEAARRYQCLGRELESVRAFYGVGSALLRLGRFDDAIFELRATRQRFLAATLVEEAGLSGLGIVEAQLMLGATADAAILAENIVREFTAAGLSRRAVAALAYLKEAIATSNATAEDVRGVRTYLRDLRDDPARVFAPIN
jgi:tetratricopeptide (TPR) repeat protein